MNFRPENVSLQTAATYVAYSVTYRSAYIARRFSSTFPVFMPYLEGRLPFSTVIPITCFIGPTTSRGNLKDTRILRNPCWEALV